MTWSSSGKCRAYSGFNRILFDGWAWTPMVSSSIERLLSLQSTVNGRRLMPEFGVEFSLTNDSLMLEAGD